MAELIACRGCLQPNCEGCNINTLANMFFSGKFDCLMDEHHCVNPEAEFAPVVHGRWIPCDPDSDVLFYCSDCETEISTSWDYDCDAMWSFCPNCGAKMDLEERKET